MHRVAYGIGIVLCIGGIAAAAVAWWQAGVEVPRQWSAPLRPDTAATPWIWLAAAVKDVKDRVWTRCRQTVPLALPVLGALAMGAVEGFDWRSTQRMRGHHAHLLHYAGGSLWAALGWWLYVVLRPAPMALAQVAPPCLVAAGIVGFTVVAGLPGGGAR